MSEQETKESQAHGSPEEAAIIIMLAQGPLGFRFVGGTDTTALQGACTITHVEPNGAFARAGVQVGDRVVGIGGQSTLQATHDELTDAFRRLNTAPESRRHILVKRPIVTSIQGERSSQQAISSADNISEGMTDSAKRSTLNVLVCCTGSVASVKVPELVSLLQRAHVSANANSTQAFSLEVRVVTTKHARHFFDVLALKQACHVTVHTDEEEWAMWTSMGDDVLHIELRRWADVLVVAPLDANTLGKLSNGLSDNLLTCVARAWDFTKPAIACPAMNTLMWDHPATDPQLKTLQKWGWQIVPPVSKRLACGDTGNGALAPVQAIVDATLAALERYALDHDLIPKEPVGSSMSVTLDLSSPSPPGYDLPGTEPTAGSAISRSSRQSVSHV